MFGQWSYCWVHFVTEGTPSSLVPKGGACFVRSRRVAPMSVQVSVLVMCQSPAPRPGLSPGPGFAEHVTVPATTSSGFPPGVFVTEVYIYFAAAISIHSFCK